MLIFISSMMYVFVHFTLSTLNGAWNMDERIMLKHEKIICTYIYVLYILNMIMNTFYDSSANHHLSIAKHQTCRILTSLLGPKRGL